MKQKLQSEDKQIQQEVLMIKNMISGKFGKEVDLSNLDGILSQEAIELFRKEEIRRSAMFEAKKCL